MYFPGNPSSYEFSIFLRIFLCPLSKESAITSLDVFDFFFTSFATADENMKNLL